VPVAAAVSHRRAVVSRDESTLTSYEKYRGLVKSIRYLTRTKSLIPNEIVYSQRWIFKQG